MTQEEKNTRSKNEIITATINEFAKQGFENASLNRICKENNISKGKMYHYFNSKEEIFCECINYIFHSFSKNVKSFNPDRTASTFENIHNYYKEILIYWANHSDHYIVLNISANTFNRNIEEGIKQGKLEYINTVKRKLLEIIKLEKNNVSFTDEEKFAVVRAVNENIFTHKFSKIINLIIDKDFENAEILSKELLEFYDKLIQIFLYGILPR